MTGLLIDADALPSTGDPARFGRTCAVRPADIKETRQKQHQANRSGSLDATARRANCFQASEVVDESFPPLLRMMLGQPRSGQPGSAQRPGKRWLTSSSGRTRRSSGRNQSSRRIALDRWSNRLKQRDHTERTAEAMPSTRPMSPRFGLHQSRLPSLPKGQGRAAQAR